jgi:hypothetical protein
MTNADEWARVVQARTQHATPTCCHSASGRSGRKDTKPRSLVEPWATYSWPRTGPCPHRGSRTTTARVDIAAQFGELILGLLVKGGHAPVDWRL